MEADRSKHIGGSDIAAILGVDRFRTPLKVYQQKRGEAGESELNPHMKRGLFMEPHIKDLVSLESGYGVENATIIRHPKHKWAAGTPDGYLIPNNASERQTPGILEVKAPMGRVYAKVIDEGPFSSWVMQCQWYMMLAELEWALLAVFSTDDWMLKTFEIEGNADLQGKLLTLGDQFWQRTQKGIPPEETVEAVEVPKISGEAIMRDDEEWCAAMDAYGSAHDLKASADDLEHAALARLKELAGECGKYIGGGGRMTFSMQQGRATFQRPHFEVEHPAIPLDPYYKRGQPFERCTVTINKAEE